MKSRSLLRLILFATISIVSSACQRVRAAPDLPAVPAPTFTDEPITEAPATPNPGDETVVKDPFAPYGIGPPEHAIQREQLRPEERAALDRAHNQTAATLEQYRQAVLQRSAAVGAEVAAHQLGVDHLATIGVVP